MHPPWPAELSPDPLPALEAILREMGTVAVALSGGVDSLTLAAIAHGALGAEEATGGAEMFHAVSPAVPPEATARVRAVAAARGWRLRVFDAGEFEDVNYRQNPVNRCFFCKTNLYGSIRRQTAKNIVSGANLDDLGEYRPGLQAARDHAVRHPFVEARVDKKTVRALASRLGLGGLADLPAAPCLASRVETGIPIQAGTLRVVHAVETRVSTALSPRTVRCRVRAEGVVVELDPESLARLGSGQQEDLGAEIAEMFAAAGTVSPVSFTVYRTGSAFLV